VSRFTDSPDKGRVTPPPVNMQTTKAQRKRFETQMDMLRAMVQQEGDEEDGQQTATLAPGTTDRQPAQPAGSGESTSALAQLS
jgi:hypothetical protein